MVNGLYKGYWIDCDSSLDPESGRWGALVEIRLRTKSGPKEGFSLCDNFATKEEAEAFAIRAGREWIDREF